MGLNRNGTTGRAMPDIHRSESIEQSTLWQEVCDQLKEQIGTRRYRLWFGRTELQESEDGGLCIGVPNAVVLGFLEDRYRTVLEDLAERISGRSVSVRFRISARLFREARRSQSEVAAVQGGGTAVEAGGESSAKSSAAGAAAEAAESHKRMRLEDFIVGDCNRMAYAASMEVIRLRAPRFNSLYVYGEHGLGKTHLLRGIEQSLRENGRGREAVYAPAEGWTNEFFRGLRGGPDLMQAFRNRYRGCDVMLLDDMRFLSSKATLQGEFSHTFDALAGRGKVVVMAAEVHPRELPRLDASLCNRIMSGLVVKVDRPDLETRLAILKRKGEELGLECEEDVYELLAESYRQDVRELEGVLQSVRAYTQLEGVGRIDVESARRALRSGGGRGYVPQATAAHVEQAVIERFGVSRSDLHSRMRSRGITRYRHLCMYLIRKLTGESLEQIGAYYGKKNHSTVRHAIRKVEGQLDGDAVLRRFVDDLLRRYGQL